MKTLYGVWNEFTDMYEVYTEDLTLAKEYVRVHEYKCGERFTIKTLNITDSIEPIDTIYIDAEAIDRTIDIYTKPDFTPNFKIYTQLKNEWGGIPSEDITISLSYKKIDGYEYRMISISFTMDSKVEVESRDELLERSKERANTIYSLFRDSDVWKGVSKPAKFYFSKDTGFVITY